MNAVIGNIEDNAESLYYAARVDRLEHGTNVHHAEEGVVHALEMLDRISDGRGNPSALVRYPTVVPNMAATLSKAISEDTATWPIPNEPDKLALYQAYISILNRLRDGLSAIAAAIDNMPDGQTAEVTSMATGINAGVRSWLENNLSMVIDFGFKTGLLGGSCWVLTMCGAPPLPAAILSALNLRIISVKEAAEILTAAKGLMKKGDGD